MSDFSDDAMSVASVASMGGSSDEGSDFESLMASFFKQPEKPKPKKRAAWYKFWKKYESSSDEEADSGKKKQKSANALFVNPFGSSGRRTARQDREAMEDEKGGTRVKKKKKKKKGSDDGGGYFFASSSSSKRPDPANMWFPGEIDAMENQGSMFGDFDSIAQIFGMESSEPKKEDDVFSPSKMKDDLKKAGKSAKEISRKLKESMEKHGYSPRQINDKLKDLFGPAGGSRAAQQAPKSAISISTKAQEWVPAKKVREIDSWKQWATQLRIALDAPLETITADSDAFRVYKTTKAGDKVSRKSSASSSSTLDPEAQKIKDGKKWVPEPPPCGCDHGYPIRKDGSMGPKFSVPSKVEKRLPFYDDPTKDVPPLWPKPSDSPPKRTRKTQQSFTSGIIGRPVAPNARPSKSMHTYL